MHFDMKGYEKIEKRTRKFVCNDLNTLLLKNVVKQIVLLILNTQNYSFSNNGVPNISIPNMLCI